MRYMCLFFLLINITCKGQKEASRKGDDRVDPNLARLTLLVKDNYSGSDIPETLVIKDAKALKGFYARVNRTRKPGLPVPAIDFTKEMVLIYCSGKLNANESSELSVQEVLDDKVVIKTSKVKKNKATSTAEITPFILYKMPLTTKEIVLKKEQ